MKILVSGSEGYIGSKVCKLLEAEGHEVVRFDRKLNSHLEEMGEVDLIYHFAAQIDVQYSMTHPYYDAMDNIVLTTQILERYPNTRIIYPASASSVNIQSPYGLSKKVATDYIKLLHKDYVILMLPNVWGDGGHGAIDLFMKSDVINIFGDGTQSRTIVNVHDVARAFVMAKDWETGEYTLGGEVVTVNEIARRIGKPIIYHPGHKGEIFASVIPNTAPNFEPEIMLK